MLTPGLYEQVITKALNKQLADETDKMIIGIWFSLDLKKQSEKIERMSVCSEQFAVI